MPIDANLILRAGQMPDLGETLQRGLTLRQLAKQNQISDKTIADEQAVKDAFTRGTIQNPDGTTSLDRKATLASLYKVAPMKAMDIEKTFNESDIKDSEAKLKAITQNAETAKALAWSIHDEDSYQVARQKAIQLGLPNADKTPPHFDPDYVKHMQLNTLKPEEQLKNTENGLKRQELVQNYDQKAAEALDKHLSIGWTGRSGQAGIVQGKINAAEAAQALIDQGRNQDGGLDSRQIEELAQSTSKLLGSGTTASARIEALVPHTFWGNAQSLKEYLSNNPTGAGQQAFVKRLEETVQREKELAQTQQRQYQIEGLVPHQGLKKRNPDLYNQILQSKGIDSSMIDVKGRYKAPPKVVPLEHLSDDELDKAYKAAGGK